MSKARFQAFSIQQQGVLLRDAGENGVACNSTVHLDATATVMASCHVHRSGLPQHEQPTPDEQRADRGDEQRGNHELLLLGNRRRMSLMVCMACALCTRIDATTA